MPKRKGGRGRRAKGNAFNVTKSQTNSGRFAETSSNPEPSNETPEELQINPQDLDLDAPRSERVAIMAPENASITDNTAPISSNIRNGNLPEPLNATPEEPLQISQAMDTSRSQTRITAMGNAPVMDRATPPSSLTGARKKTNACYQAENFPKTLGNPETPTATPAEPPQITQSIDTSRSQRETIIAPEKTLVMDNAAPPSPLTGARKKKNSYQTETISETLNDTAVPKATPAEPPQITKSIDTPSQTEAIAAHEKAPVMDNAATPSSLKRAKERKHTYSQIERVSETVSCPEPPNLLPEEPPQIPQDTFRSQRGTTKAPEKTPVMDNAAPPLSLTGDIKKKHTHSQIENVPKTISGHEPPNVISEEPPQIPQSIDIFRSERGAILAREKTPVMDNATPLSSLTGDKKKKQTHTQIESVPETVSGPESPIVTPEEPPQISQDTSRSQRGTIISLEKTPVMDNAAPPSSLIGDKKKKHAHSRIEIIPKTVSDPEPPNVTPEQPPQIPQAIDTFRSQKRTIIAPEKSPVMKNDAPSSSLTGDKKKKHMYSQTESVPITLSGHEPSNVTPEQLTQISQATETSRYQRGTTRAPEKTPVMDNAAPHTHSQIESVPKTLSGHEPPNAIPEEPAHFLPDTFRSQRGTIVPPEKTPEMSNASPPSSLTGAKKKTKHTYSQTESVPKTPNDPETPKASKKLQKSTSDLKVTFEFRAQDYIDINPYIIDANKAEADVPNDMETDNFDKIDLNEYEVVAPNVAEIGNFDIIDNFDLIDLNEDAVAPNVAEIEDFEIIDDIEIDGFVIVPNPKNPNEFKRP